MKCPVGVGQEKQMNDEDCWRCTKINYWECDDEHGSCCAWFSEHGSKVYYERSDGVGVWTDNERRSLNDL